jgi:hypothetical protein
MKTFPPANSFSIPRVLQLCLRFFVYNRRSWLIGFGAATGFILAIWLLPLILASDPGHQYSFEHLQGTAMLLYVLGGLFLTSNLFGELHTPSSSYQFLTLPATTFEKLFAAWLISSLLYTIIVMTGLIGLSFIVESVSAIHTGTGISYTLFNPFSDDALNSIGNYFVFHSFFMLGAVYFRKNNFLKTFLSLILLFFLLISISTTALLIMGDSVEAVVEIKLFDNMSGIQILFWTVLTLFILFLSYIRLRNKQVI